MNPFQYTMLAAIDNDKIYQVDQMGRKEIGVTSKIYTDTLELLKKFQEKSEQYKKMLEDLNPICFYVAMNMMYSDYYQPERKTDTYAILAKDFLEDEDAPKDKLKRYLKAMHS